MSSDNKKEFPAVASLRFAVISVATLLLAFATGCSKPQDITNDPRYGNFSKVVGTYKTKVPLSLRRGMDNRTYLCNTNRFDQRSHELSVVPVGTKIRVEHLVLWPSWEADVIDITGSLTAGLDARKTLILDPYLLARNRWFGGPESNTNWNVNPEMLEIP